MFVIEIFGGGTVSGNDPDSRWLSNGGKEVKRIAGWVI